jgi:hypothetical protein
MSATATSTSVSTTTRQHEEQTRNFLASQSPKSRWELDIIKNEHIHQHDDLSA